MTKRTNSSTHDRAARVRAARALAGLDQPELARVLGISERTLRRIEAGRRPISKMEAHAIAIATNAPVEFLEHGLEAALAREVLSRDVRHELRAIVRAAVGRSNGRRALAGIVDEPELANGSPLEVK